MLEPEASSDTGPGLEPHRKVPLKSGRFRECLQRAAVHLAHSSFKTSALKNVKVHDIHGGT